MERRNDIDRRQKEIEIAVDRRKLNNRRLLKNRRSGVDRRTVLTGRCRFIDRRDRAYFESLVLA
jgi:hypothetical protein